MNIPSLAIPPHEHYKPELGDKISDLLRTQATDASYHLLTSAQFCALAEIESPEAPILSLYLQLGGGRRVGNAWHTAFNSLRAATPKPISDRRKWQA
jgi:hypothetical protein